MKSKFAMENECKLAGATSLLEPVILELQNSTKQ
jgi:hypothetical protein